jgi:hypothetical protein
MKTGNNSVEYEKAKGKKQATTSIFVPTVNLTIIEEIL